MLDYALDVFRSADSKAKSLVNQDLHPDNVLRSSREPWLVIDPKPLVGEREANGVALLRNAAFEGGTSMVRGWLDTLTELGLDRERLRGWGVAHAFAWAWSGDGGWSRRQVDAARSIFAASP
jgi:streptomycin 6-kinase